MALPSEIYGQQFQCVQIGTQQMAIPHVGARYPQDGERVSQGIDPQLFITWKGHPNPDSCGRLLDFASRL